MDPNDQTYQIIPCRFSATESIQEYRLKTLIYGTTIAPCLAIETIQRLAIDEESKVPKKSEDRTNSMNNLQWIPEKLRNQSMMKTTEDQIKQSFGIYWVPRDDTFHFKIDVSTITKIAKRMHLSKISSFFNPLGWIVPMTSSTRKWKNFVANRVAQINNLLPKDRWRHVSPKYTPASNPIPEEINAYHIGHAKIEEDGMIKYLIQKEFKMPF